MHRSTLKVSKSVTWNMSFYTASKILSAAAITLPWSCFRYKLYSKSKPRLFLLISWIRSASLSRIRMSV